MSKVEQTFNIPAITLEHANVSYGDWIYNKFLLDKTPGTLFEFSTTVDCDVPHVEMLNNFKSKFGPPVYVYDTLAATGVKHAHFSDERTFFAKVIKNKTVDNFSRYSLSVYCINEAFGKESLKLLSSLAKEVKADSVYVISSSNGCLMLNNLGSLKYNFLRENYENKVLNGFDYIVSEYNKPIPSGRIAIVNGLPGGGKTNLLKGVISAINNSTTILLPAKFVVELDSPSIVSLLLEERADHGYLDNGNKNKPILFIVEDADDCLVPRDGSNMSTISSLLNYTDGIFGSMLDLRIIATTNADHVDFDKALLRPGRLCAHIKVDALSPEKASEIFKRVSQGKEKFYDKPVTLAQVYSDVRGGFIQPDLEKDNKVGF
jgi:hypothetical protein